MSESEKKISGAPAADVEVGTAADVEEIMKKYDRESNTRIWEGTPAVIVRWITAIFSMFIIFMNTFVAWDERFRRPLFLGLVMLLVFLYYPAKKGSQRVNCIPWYDILLAIVGTFPYFFYIANLKKIADLGTRINKSFLIGNVPALVVLGIIGILVLVECCRRVVGIPIIVVASCFVLYAFTGGGKNLTQVVFNLFYTTEGVIGTPINVCCTYIVLFVIFGAFLEATGVADFFISCANIIAGWASGGPAKVAVISSALCGMVSGSSVGNTVTTGAVTIPMMKRTGYPPEFAGAVEAAASTGGQIMPPIMGAAAFLMAEMVGVPYSDIIVRAILPAFLYFAGIFMMVHFKAKRLGLAGVPREELPKGKDVLPKAYLIVPLVVLVYMILAGFTMATAAVYSTVFCIICSMISKEKGGKALVMAIPLLPMFYLTFFSRGWSPLSFMGQHGALLCCGIAVALMALNVALSKPNREALPMVVTGFENGGKNSLSVAIACGMAGIISGVVTMTGLGHVIISAVVRIADGKLIIALILTMVCCIILGMGVPTTANYIIMATTCAPILSSGMGMNLMAANMFVFYFGIVADITPPVALAAYAGSAIAKAPPMKTALNATRLAIAAFIIPYIFAFNNAMLFINTTPIQVIGVVVTSILGMLAISIGMIGYFLREVKWPVRVLMIAAGLLMIYPETISDIVGIVALIALYLVQRAENAREKKAA